MIDINTLEQDKYLHYKYGFILFLFFNLFTSKALSIVSFIAKSKEFVDGLGFGTKDINDYLATVNGAKDAMEFHSRFFERG